MRINDKYIIRNINDDVILIDKFENNRIYKFSNTSKFIINCIINRFCFEEIVTELVKKYNINCQLAETDVNDFLDELMKVGIIEND